MNLYEMIAAAQGGQAMFNLGRQFGLSEQQSAEALRHLLPAFSTGLKRSTASPLDLSAFLNALNGGHHASYYDNVEAFGDTRTRDDGNAILDHMFGSKEISRAVAERAAQQTGIGAEILKAMLPYIASIIMGALFKKGQNPIGDILGEILGGQAPQGQRQRQSPSAQPDSPFGPLSDILKGGGRSPDGKPLPGNLPQNGADIFGQMFDADGDGTAMDDIFDAMLGTRR